MVTTRIAAAVTKMPTARMAIVDETDAPRWPAPLPRTCKSDINIRWSWLVLVERGDPSESSGEVSCSPGILVLYSRDIDIVLSKRMNLGASTLPMPARLATSLRGWVCRTCDLFVSSSTGQSVACPQCGCLRAETNVDGAEQAAREGEWECRHCTFLNPMRLVLCAMCLCKHSWTGTDSLSSLTAPAEMQMMNRVAPTNDNCWKCPVCTAENHWTRALCSLCCGSDLSLDPLRSEAHLPGSASSPGRMLGADRLKDNERRLHVPVAYLAKMVPDPHDTSMVWWRTWNNGPEVEERRHRASLAPATVPLLTRYLRRRASHAPH